MITHTDVVDADACFVADPFMVREHGLWYMFFEVWINDKHRGEIGLATSSDAQTWEYRQIVLREPYHLSYPYVFKWRNEWFMIPETLGAHYIRLYRASSFPFGWEFVGNLLPGQFADASVVRHEDYWWMFACSTPRGHDELRLFYSPELPGPWQEHPLSPIIKANPHIARPAGRLIGWNGGIIRYTQDCFPTYGRQVNAFHVHSITLSEYREIFVPSNPVLPMGLEPWTRRGMHHVDAHEVRPGEWVACVDGYGFPA